VPCVAPHLAPHNHLRSRGEGSRQCERFRLGCEISWRTSHIWGSPYYVCKSAREVGHKDRQRDPPYFLGKWIMTTYLHLATSRPSSPMCCTVYRITRTAPPLHPITTPAVCVCGRWCWCPIQNGKDNDDFLRAVAVSDEDGTVLLAGRAVF